MRIHDLIKRVVLLGRNTKEHSEACSELKEIVTKEGTTSFHRLLASSEVSHDANSVDAIPNIADIKNDDIASMRMNNFFLNSLDSIQYKLLSEDIDVLTFLEEKLKHTTDLKTTAFIISYILCSDSTLSVVKPESELRDKLKEYLSTESEGDHLIPQHLVAAISALKRLLHSYDIQHRLTGRQLCETYRITLTLPLMLMLSADGINGFDESEKLKQNGIVLVIGDTGSGKSTTINQLNGVKYELRRAGRSRAYLECSDTNGVSTLASVGHGSVSRSLFSQIYQHGDQPGFIDMPGFKDTRVTAERACAAIGPALAVSQVDSIQAIIITLDYTSLTSSRGAAFKDLCRTIDMGIRDLENLCDRENSPVLFCVTKIPNDSFGAPFNADDSKEAFLAELGLIQLEHTDIENEIVKLNDKIIEDETSAALLDYLKNKLIDTYTYFLDYYKNHFDVFLSLYINNPDLLAESELESQSINYCNQVLTKHYANEPDDFIKQLAKIINEVFRASAQSFHAYYLDSSKASELAGRLESLRSQSADLQSRLTELTLSIEERKERLEQYAAEKHVIDLIIKRPENIFMMRGYKAQSGDQDDHRETLLSYLKQLKERSSEPVSTELLAFNPDEKEYRPIIEWVASTSNSVLELLEKYVNCGSKILTLREEQNNIEERLRAEVKMISWALDSNSISSSHPDGDLETNSIRDADLTLQYEQEITRMITKQEDMLKNMQADLNRLESERVIIERRRLQIEQSPPIDYRSASNVNDSPPWLSNLFKLSSWKYTFYVESEEKNRKESSLETFLNTVIQKQNVASSELEIHHIELSSVTENGRLVFPSPLSQLDTTNDPKIVNWTVSSNVTTSHIINGISLIKPKDNQTSAQEFGQFVLSKDIDLAKGKFSVKYYPKLQNFDSLLTNFNAGVRIFVEPKNIPKYQKELANLYLFYNIIKEKYDNLTHAKESIQASIKSDREYLSLLKHGFLNQENQLKRLAIIQSLMINTGEDGTSRLSWELEHLRHQILLKSSLIQEPSKLVEHPLEMERPSEELETLLAWFCSESNLALIKQTLIVYSAEEFESTFHITQREFALACFGLNLNDLALLQASSAAATREKTLEVASHYIQFAFEVSKKYTFSLENISSLLTHLRNSKKLGLYQAKFKDNERSQGEYWYQFKFLHCNKKKKDREISTLRLMIKILKLQGYSHATRLCEQHYHQATELQSKLSSISGHYRYDGFKLTSEAIDSLSITGDAKQYLLFYAKQSVLLQKASSFYYAKSSFNNKFWLFSKNHLCVSDATNENSKEFKLFTKAIKLFQKVLENESVSKTFFVTPEYVLASFYIARINTYMKKDFDETLWRLETLLTIIDQDLILAFNYELPINFKGHIYLLIGKNYYLTSQYSLAEAFLLKARSNSMKQRYFNYNNDSSTAAELETQMVTINVLYGHACIAFAKGAFEDGWEHLVKATKVFTDFYCYLNRINFKNIATDKASLMKDALEVYNKSTLSKNNFWLFENKKTASIPVKDRLVEAEFLLQAIALFDEVFLIAPEQENTYSPMHLLALYYKANIMTYYKQTPEAVLDILNSIVGFYTQDDRYADYKLDDKLTNHFISHVYLLKAKNYLYLKNYEMAQSKLSNARLNINTPLVSTDSSCLGLIHYGLAATEFMLDKPEKAWQSLREGSELLAPYKDIVGLSIFEKMSSPPGESRRISSTEINYHEATPLEAKLNRALEMYHKHLASMQKHWLVQSCPLEDEIDASILEELCSLLSDVMKNSETGSKEHTIASYHMALITTYYCYYHNAILMLKAVSQRLEPSMSMRLEPSMSMRLKPPKGQKQRLEASKRQRLEASNRQILEELFMRHRLESSSLRNDKTNLLATVYVWLARNCFYSELDEEALAYLDKAHSNLIENQEDTEECKLNIFCGYGNIYYALQEHELAISYLRQALEIENRDDISNLLTQLDSTFSLKIN